MPADTIIRAQLMAVGGDQMLTVLRAVRQEIVGVAQQRARVTVDADTVQARQSIAQIRQETAELRAAKYGLTITADTAQASRSLQQITLETQRINALVARARVQVDTSQANQALDETDKKLSGVADKIGRFALYGAGYALYGGISQAVGAAGDAIIGYTGRLEQARVAYTNLLGSAQAADQFLAQQQKFAASTPFDLSDVQRYSQLLLATGTQAKEIIPTLNTLGNAVSAIGGNSDTLGHVVLALSQLRNSVKADAQDMNQLIQAGINGWDLLAQHLGVTQAKVREMAKSGQISGADAAAAIIDELSNRNVGLMEQQSRTFLGRLENFQDNFKQELSRAGKPLFDEFSADIGRAGDALQSPKFRAFVGDMVSDLTTLVHAGAAVAEAIGKIPTPVLEAGVHVAELAVAVKTAEVAFAAVRTVLAPVISLISTETAAHVRNTEAIEAETVAANENALAKERMGAASVAGGAETAVAGTATRGAGAAALGLSALESGGIVVAIAEGWREGTKVLPDILRGDFAQALKDVTINAPGAIQNAVALAQRTGLVGNANANLGTASFDTGALPQGVLPGPLQGISEQGGNVVVAQMLAQVAAGTLTADRARASFDKLADSFGGLLHNADDLRKQFEDGLTPAVVAYADSLGDAADAQVNAYSRMAQATHALAAGASAEDISRAIFGKTGAGTTATQEQIKAAQDAIAPLVAAYEAQQQAVVARARQFGQDLQQATQQAAQAVQAVDLSKGLASIADAAPGLDKARDALHALGQESSSLNALASLADEWKAITAATDKASASFRGYLLLTSETDQRIQQLESLKKSYDDAADAADAARKKGQPLSADQRTLLDNRPAVDANIQAQIDKLHTGQAGDLTAAVKVVPDFKGADDQMRQWVQSHGGAAALDLGIKANTAQAEAEVKGFLDKPRELVVNAVLNTDGLPAWAKNLLVNAAGGAPASGTAASAGGRDLSRFGGGDQSDSHPISGRREPSGGGGGFNTYQPLSQTQYNSIVPSGPLANPEVYAGLLAAAQKYGVDPRALLAFIRNENVAPALAAVNNFGGIKGQGGPPAPASEGGTYAAYSSPQAFFEALAANLSTGAYAGDYQRGNLAAVRQRYVAGSAAPSAQQQANIANTVSDYQSLAADYPASAATETGGIGGTITPPIPQTAKAAARRVSLTMPTPDPGAGANVNVAAMRKRAQELAGTPYVYGGGHGAGDSGGFDCSGYVMDVLRAGGVSVPWTDAGGLYRWAQTPDGKRLLGLAGIQLGFFNPGAGGANEHVAINLGGEWFEDGGVRGNAGPSPNAAQGLNAFVGTARPISGGAAPAAPPSSGNRAPDSRFDAGEQGTLNLADPNTDAARAAAAQFRKEQADLKDSVLATKAAQDEFNRSLQGLSTANLKDAVAQYGSMLGYFQKLETAKLPDNADEAQKQQAVNLALADTLNFGAAYDHLLKDIQDHTGDVAADTARLAAIVGGPLANAYAQAARASARITAATAETKRLTDAHDKTVAQRQADDQAASRAATIAGWAQQDAQAAMQARQTAAQNRLQDAQTAAQNRNQDQQTAENSRYTGVSRDEQDRQRALQFSQQVQGTDLQNKLADLQKSQQNTTYNRTAQEQLVQSDIRVAGTSQAAAPLEAQLAGMHDRDLAQKDLDNKAIEGIQLQIREQAKQANLESYNLETETIRESRKHEDIIANLAAESTAQQRSFAAQGTAQSRTFAAEQQAESEHQQQIQRSAQLQSWQLQDQRAQEDAAYKTAIDAQAKIKDDAQASLDAAQQALTAWQQTGQVVASAATSASALTAAGGSVTGTAGSGRRLGAYAAGGTIGMGEEGIVGDPPGGGVSGYEEQVRVTPQGAIVTPLAAKPTGSGGISLSFGDLNVTVGDGDAWMDQARRAFEQRLQQVKRELLNANGKHARATGRG
jgi:tape measure domain-containing protein